jgi:hypothetical protein
MTPNRRKWTMSEKSLFCFAEFQEQAERIVAQLQESGFNRQDIALIFPDKETHRDFAHQVTGCGPEGIVAGASTVGLLGGIGGWFAGMGLLSVATESLATGVLGGVVSGVLLGGGIGGWIGARQRKIEARRYRGKLKGGKILISIHVKNLEEMVRAREILDLGGGRKIFSAQEDLVPQDTIYDDLYPDPCDGMESNHP